MNSFKNSLKLLIVFYFSLFNIAFFASAETLTCLDVNTAPKEDLIKIRHIGQSRAEQIIELRKEKPFSSLDDLSRVKGIGPARISDIKEQGLTCLGPGLEAKTQPRPGQAESDFWLKEKSQPKINLSYPLNNPVNREIRVEFSVQNLKNAAYDIKISIEKEKVISSIYNEKEDKWQSSRYYLNNLFFGSSFEKTFKLKIREENLSFQGEADILARIRENGKSDYLEHKNKINLSRPEYEPKKEFPAHSSEYSAALSQTALKIFNSRLAFLTASILALFSGIVILTLKKSGGPSSVKKNKRRPVLRQKK